MAFTATPVSRVLDSNGTLREEGTYTNTGGSTGGTITADDGTVISGVSEIRKITHAYFKSNGSVGVFPKNDTTIAENKLIVACTADDDGVYTLFGKGA